MKLVQKTKYSIAALLFVFATTALSFADVQFASALSRQWTGGGDGTSFSDVDNWSTGVVPEDGDDLTFSVTGLTEQVVLDNDISGLSLSGITFSGNASSYYSYTLQGEDLTLSGNVVNTISGANADYAIPSIQSDLTLASNVTVNRVNLGVEGATLNLQSHNLTYSGTASCGLNVRNNVSGSGGLNITGTSVNVKGANTYTGPTTVTGTAWVAPTALGTSAGGTTVSGSGELSIVHIANASVAEPFTFGGNGNFAAVQNYIECAGGGGPAVTLTLTGGVTLTSNFLYKGVNNLVVTNPYTENGHAFTVAGGYPGTLKTPAGESSAPKETIELNGTATGYVNVGTNQTAILNGTRESIGVQDGGVLKGTGTTTTLYVNEGGKVAPGNSPGTITVLESLTLTGTYEAELLNSDTYDQLVVGEDYSDSGNAVYLNTGASLNVSLYEGWSIKKGDTFTIIDNRSETAVNGTFDGLAEGAQLAIDGVTFNISYVGGDGNDIVLTALTDGTDPDAPNTGALQMARKNPLVIAGLGVAAAALLIALAVRRRQTSK